MLSAEHCCILTDHKQRESTALHKKETKAKTNVKERIPVRMMNNPSNDDEEPQLPLHDIRLCMCSRSRKLGWGDVLVGVQGTTVYCICDVEL